MTAITEVHAVADTDNDNDFRTWMKSEGYNSKQVTQAGETIGMSPSLAGHTSRGLRELTDTERLAMAAVTANLPRWSPDNASYILAHKTLSIILEDEISKVGSDAEAEAVRAIKAVIRSEAHRIATEGRVTQTDDAETDRKILDLLRSAARDTSGK